MTFIKGGFNGSNGAMDRDHRIRVAVSGLTGKDREEKIAALSADPGLLTDRLSLRLRLFKRRRLSGRP